MESWSKSCRSRGRIVSRIVQILQVGRARSRASRVAPPRLDSCRFASLAGPRHRLPRSPETSARFSLQSDCIVLTHPKPLCGFRCACAGWYATTHPKIVSEYFSGLIRALWQRYGTAQMSCDLVTRRPRSSRVPPGLPPGPTDLPGVPSPSPGREEEGGYQSKIACMSSFLSLSESRRPSLPHLLPVGRSKRLQSSHEVERGPWPSAIHLDQPQPLSLSRERSGKLPEVSEAPFSRSIERSENAAGRNGGPVSPPFLRSLRLCR